MIYILFGINFIVLTYFAAILHERTTRNARDINAIAARLRIQEDNSKAHEIAYDFRIRVIENLYAREHDTGFNMQNLRGD